MKTAHVNEILDNKASHTTSHQQSSKVIAVLVKVNLAQPSSESRE